MTRESTDGEGRGLRRLFRSLRDRNYRLFFLGQVVSLTGTWMQRVGQDWLVLQLTDSAVALSVGIALQFVPLLLFGLWGGVLVDRFDTRRLVIWTQSLAGLLALVLGLLTLTGVVELWMVYALAFALGCVTVVEQPARQAFVSELVGPEGVANAVSLNSSINQAARLVGPAVAGLVIAAVGVATAFLINAASFLAVIAGLLAMDVRALRVELPVPRAAGQLREGLRYTMRSPQLRAPLLLVLVISTLTQNYRVVLPLLATDVFAGGPGTYGTLMAAVGAGALLGGLLCAYFARPSQRLVLAIAAGFGVATLIAAAAPTLALLVVLLIPVGAGNTSFNATANALVQLRSAGPFRGRVLAVRTIVFLGTTPIGAPLVGWLSGRYGPRWGLAVGGAGALLVALIALPTWRLDRQPAPEPHELLEAA